MADHFDVLIVGAGLSGIGAAHHLQTRLPQKTYAILEGRETIGGTWDLFRYPGIRSDSDMHTLGYNFRPWIHEKAIADGPAILEYVRAVARDGGIDRHIRFGHKVVRASWSTADARWTLECETPDGPQTLTAGFVHLNSGYYRYDEGYTPQWDGFDDFGGQVIHPQHWPEDFEPAGKRIVVIGSGATAVTLVPALAKQGAQVTMLQRTPSYVLSLPDKDPIANGLRKVLPDKVAYGITRWKNVAQQTFIYQASQRFPNQVRKVLRTFNAKRLPEHLDVDVHFKPPYNPWDQRLCLVPNGDLYKAFRKGTATIVTDHIASFTDGGIRLRSGQELEADVVVTATGLNLLALGGVQLSVDGADVEINKTVAYKAMMLGGVPNLAFTVGYTNASWTLKADLVAEYVCRLLARMDEAGVRQATPTPSDASMQTAPLMDFAAGYVLRSLDQFPVQGTKAPWKLKMNYLLDVINLRHGQVDEELVLSNPRPTAAPREPVAA